MANMSVGGLVSGLDTATIISQLMQLEARPQANLKNRVSSAERAVSALQTLNAKIASIGTHAGDLAKLANWTPMKATSSNAGVTVAAAQTAQLTSLELVVNQTATSSRAVFVRDLVASAEATVYSSLTVTFDVGGALPPLPLTDRSLEGVATAINAAEVGLQASLVRVGGTNGAPTYQLHVISTETGEDSGFTIDDGTGSFLGGLTPDSSDGHNASVTVNGQVLNSSSNVIKGLMPGVDVTLAAGAAGQATIAIARDTDSLASKVKSMVDVANAALDELSSLSKTGTDPKDRGLLAGDSTLRGVRNQLIQSVTGGINGESLAPYGIQTDRNGRLVFDEAKFKAAYAADPDKTASMFADPAPPAGTTPSPVGFAATLQALSKTFSDKIDGTVTSAIKNRQSAIKGWQDDIADWDVRLTARQTALQRQYTALESALGKLQSQGNWLAGQIASLPQMSSGQ